MRIIDYAGKKHADFDEGGVQYSQTLLRFASIQSAEEIVEFDPEDGYRRLGTADSGATWESWPSSLKLPVTALAWSNENAIVIDHENIWLFDHALTSGRKLISFKTLASRLGPEQGSLSLYRYVALSPNGKRAAISMDSKQTYYENEGRREYATYELNLKTYALTYVGEGLPSGFLDDNTIALADLTPNPRRYKSKCRVLTNTRDGWKLIASLDQDRTRAKAGWLFVRRLDKLSCYQWVSRKLKLERTESAPATEYPFEICFQ